MTTLGGFDAVKARLMAVFQRGETAEGKAVPVRDWINVGSRSGTSTRVLGFDQALLWMTVALIALGAVMVYSASIALPDSPKFAKYAATHFISRHILSIAVAFVFALDFCAGLGVVGGGVDSWHRQSGQQIAPLDSLGRDEFSAE
jgi:cell division protein FtsW